MYRFLLPTQGGLRVRQENTEIALPSRVGALVSFEAKVAMSCSADLHCMIMSIPRREIESRTGHVPFTAIDMTTGLGRVVHDMQVTLSEERASLSQIQFEAACDRMVELLCMVIAGDARPDAEGHQDDVAATIRRYVRDHAADRHLSGTAIAHALGWSLRKIQLVLERAGTTPRDLIREERLRLAREQLLSPAYHHHTITTIAHNTGFSSVSAFSTAFRRRYGLSPRDLRNHLPHGGRVARRSPTGEPVVVQ
jgi:AraC-like DNA-binding protein